MSKQGFYRSIFFVMPAFMDALIGVFMFVSARRIAMLGASSVVVSATMIAWAVCYGLTSFILSKTLTRRSAPRILWLAISVCAVCLFALAFVNSIPLQLALLLGMGIGTGLYFAPFQTQAIVFATTGTVPTARDVATSASKYTFSWSLGMAMGPFLSAFIWGLGDEKTGWRYCYFTAFGFAILVMIFTAILQGYVNRRYKEMGITGNEKEKEQAGDALAKDGTLTGNKDLIVTAWLFQGIGYVTIGMMRTYIPDFATKVLDMSTFHQGLVISTISFAQAAMALCCWKADRWAHRPLIPVTISVIAGISFIFFAFATDWRIYLCSAIALGAFSGTFCTLATFHGMLNPGKSAFYLSVNETLVGVGSIFSPLIGGLLATCGQVRLPFMVCLAACLTCAGCYLYGTCSKKKN